MPRKPFPPPDVSPELLGLLRAAKDAPEDDAPRLVLADWLEEHGGPADVGRAELVRVQCELGRTDRRTPRWDELRARVTELTCRWGDEWFGPLGGNNADLARGLLRVHPSVTTFFSKSVNAWLHGVAGVWVDSVRLFGLKPQHVRRFCSRPFLAHAAALVLSGPIGDEGLAQLLAAEHLTGLRLLSLIHCGVTASGAAALADSPRLARLTSLYLWGNPLGDAGVEALARSPASANLRELQLDRTGINSGGIHALAGSPHLSGLRELDLSGNEVGDPEALALARSSFLAGLRKLHLRGLDFGEEAAAALAERFGGPATKGAWGS